MYSRSLRGGAPSERSLARMFGEAHCNFPRRLAGNLWQEFFQFYPMDERKGLCFSVYYLLSDPLDASFSSIPGAVLCFLR